MSESQKNGPAAGKPASQIHGEPARAGERGAGEGHPIASGSGRPARRRRIPPKLYRIGEVVEYANVSRQTVHNYTTMGLLPEARWTRGGHRLYGESVFDRLDKLAELKAQHKSMQEIRQYFIQLDRQENGIEEGQSAEHRPGEAPGAGGGRIY